MHLFKGAIARGTIRTSAVLGLRLAVQAGTLLLVARLLGPNDFGAFAGIAALAVILGTLSTFGLHLVLLGEMSRDPALRDKVLAQTVPVTLVCGTLLLVIFLAICLTTLDRLTIPLSVLLSIGVAETLIQPLLSLPTWELTAMGRPARSQLLAVFPLALRLTLAASVMWIAPEEPLMMFGYAYLFASIIALAAVTSCQLSPWLPPKRWRWPNKTQWKEAASYAALNSTAMGPAELDKTLAARLLPATDAGLYAAAQRTVGAITLPVSAMMLSALPRLYREGQEPTAQTSRLLIWIFAVSTTYGLASAGALWLVAPLVEWLFGTAYHGIQDTIRWLCLAMPGMALRIAAGLVLTAVAPPWMRVSVELTGLAALGLGSVILISYFGSVGMPLAIAGAESIMAAIAVTMVIWRTATASTSRKSIGLK